MLSLIPMRLLASVLAFLAFTGGVYWYGHNNGATGVEERWLAANAAAERQMADLRAQAERLTTVEVIKYIDRVQVVREKAKTIVKEVPVYVTQESDAACVVPAGFVRVHDASAANVLPDAARADDAAASGIALSAVAGTVAENYGTCAEIRENLIGLQGWAGRMCDLVKCQ